MALMTARRAVALLFAVLIIATITIPAQANDEFSLFDSTGRPAAYVSEGLTIYLWSGAPVAYLTEDDLSDGFHVYGFNGRHLGWFISGIIRDHHGDAVGGLKEAFRSPTELEPLKASKQSKPLKSVAELPPVPPVMSRERSEIPLRAFLLQGVD
jgi:4-fold beta-flower domain-containing protein